ncbi:hypothetical protein FHQ26_02185 [Testudinibacter sp. TR-2022]|uniref:hypothetical protein n=1 Tax=Testudinibacter sp. TR-2022 TaxID=2585029 RepID=UPI001117D01B|nr:hypothetical protein [Testudinibacter sp. TR-2022]TNH05376.1 hypothetical protein FHQ22_01330 [Pasteurellaceae bacterium Phil31]TNH09919.1 hypothetical protein FHQ25_06735 [Testudinibacter sp. TR-2022]TNH12179.1 hypothetical protein FHQ26_02185 [Testudinibacter sp. TR-2022]TNH14823.1 hypothetical protein FIA56_04470 [Testudinibacter sp. TR-2022]TNH15459.1 hypothetical protein FHQ23_09990 [Testudinibacter sp. TR-2022]
MPWGDSVPVQPDLIQTQWAALQNEQPQKNFDQTELAILSPLFEQWQVCGLCEYSNEFSEINRLVLTTKGRFWASQLLGALQTFIKSRS